MQQTDKYRLNLIESSDPFLPEGLNANTQKIEEVLKGMEDGPLAEMDGRVTALEAHKFYVGTYIGTGENPQFVSLGFTPMAVCVNTIFGTDHPHWAFTGSSDSTALVIVEGGFNAGNILPSGSLHDKDRVYNFFVFT